MLLVYILNTETDKRDGLQKQLASVEKNFKAIQIEPLSSQKLLLEQNVTQAISRLNALTPIFPRAVEQAEVVSIIFSIANTYGINITALKISGLAEAVLEQVEAQSLTIYLTSEGTLPNITRFITDLNSAFPTGAVDQNTITSLGNGGKKQADIRLTIYTVQR